MSTKNKKKLIRRNISELPLLKSITEKMGLRGILNEFLPPKNKTEEITPADTLILLIYNIAREKNPLYELEGWAGSIDMRCLDYEKYQNVRFTDDRFGKVLDDLYAVDRATLMTRIVVEVIKKFNISLERIHNDSTSVSAYGDYPGKTSTGFELKRGKSKDFLPHLKQLIFSLSISADGAVPIHYKVYPGNRNDDTTHIETWNTLTKLNEAPNFLYVADCKLCSDSQLSHIVGGGGRAITNIPEFWSEVVSFKASQREAPTEKKEIWRRYNEETNQTVYFSAYTGDYATNKRGYKIHWIHSSSKRKDDYSYRERQIKNSEIELQKLSEKLNKRKYISKDVIRDACDKILKNYETEKFLEVVIEEKKESYIVKPGKGRPRNDIEQKTNKKFVYSITWNRNKKNIDAEKNIDGIYPLLSTDSTLSAKEVLMAYKYQPKLEKRFTQLKSVHNVAPLLFKKLERIEANMLLFFIALMIQSLIEREIRSKMKDHGLESLEIYPEKRDASRTTTSKVFDFFGNVFSYTIYNDTDVLEEYTDELSMDQKSILTLLSISEPQYWNGINKQSYV
ncbi:MAG: IS1634 family transposase [Silvanigrellaceae bacterium]|nr:IS1634 family transposase [Silvanigrellaceae bacterium]